MIPHWHVDAHTIDPSHDAQVRVELAKVALGHVTDIAGWNVNSKCRFSKTTVTRGPAPAATSS